MATTFDLALRERLIAKRSQLLPLVQPPTISAEITPTAAPPISGGELEYCGHGLKRTQCALCSGSPRPRRPKYRVNARREGPPKRKHRRPDAWTPDARASEVSPSEQPTEAEMNAHAAALEPHPVLSAYGLLWYDAACAAELDRVLDEAARRYADKFGRLPNIAYVNPDDLKAWATGRDPLTYKPPCSVKPKATIIPKHVWLGFEATATEDELAASTKVKA